MANKGSELLEGLLAGIAIIGGAFLLNEVFKKEEILYYKCPVCKYDKLKWGNENCPNCKSKLKWKSK